jgi:hypothetical protein
MPIGGGRIIGIGGGGPMPVTNEEKICYFMFVTTTGHRIIHQSSGPLIMSDNEDMPAITATCKTFRLMAHDAAAA